MAVGSDQVHKNLTPEFTVTFEVFDFSDNGPGRRLIKTVGFVRILYFTNMNRAVGANYQKIDLCAYGR